jgi:uncharacterized protein (DUF1800 family)
MLRAVPILALFAGASIVLAAEPLGFDNARHLLNRTSFAANADDVAAFARLTREEAADRLLAWTVKPRVTPPPAWVDEPFVSPRRARMLPDEERMRFRREQIRRGIELRGWWLQEMLTTPSPLSEKMTLFWHNHFVSSQQKVRSPQLMYRQNVLLRRHALGNFGEFLHAIARDPAMVIYLDSASNRKGRPNENFARELMELFTLGEGRYTEQDVKEAARAFTGWSIDPDTGDFLFRPMQHDDGMKTVLGRSGNLNGDDVLDILLARPETAEFIAMKLWREFVSPGPEPAEVKRIARKFRASRYDIAVALREVLVSDAFYAGANRASLVKSPVDLVVGTLRQFGFSTGEPLPFVFTTAQLGQNLFAPPNVRGWPGGEAWINSTTLLARKQFLDRMFRVEESRPPVMAMGAAGGVPRGVNLAGEDGRERYLRAMSEIRFDGSAWLAQFASANAPALERLILASTPVNALPEGLRGMDAIRHLTQDPAYQLK